jgi:hypothetical protein
LYEIDFTLKTAVFKYWITTEFSSLTLSTDHEKFDQLVDLEQAKKRLKVFGCAQIISLPNTEQNHMTD